MINLDEHLSDKDIERLLHARTSRGAMWAAHKHLLKCRQCRIALFVYDEGLAGLHLDDLYGAGTAARWRHQLKAPVDTLSFLATRELALSRLTARQIRLFSVNSDSFRDVGTLTVLLEGAHTLRKDSPAEARTMLEGAVQALENLTEWPPAEHAQLLSRALAYLGNIYRILNEFDAAREAFRQAQSYLRSEAPPDLAGLLVGFEGNLAKDQGHYELAISKLQEALVLLSGEIPALQLEAMITLANCYGEAGQVAESIATLKDIIEQFPRSVFSPGAFLACIQSLAISYAQTGHPRKAAALLPKLRRVATEEGNRLDLLRVQWAEAEIYKAEGKRTLAAAEFREVTSKFLAAQIPVDAALAALSQADMYLTLGDTKAAAELAEVLVPIFQSKGIHREATEAGLMVVQDLRREAATAGQVQKLVKRLQQRPARRRG